MMLNSCPYVLILTCNSDQEGHRVIFSVTDILPCVVHSGYGYNQPALGPIHLQDQVRALLYLQAVFVPPDRGISLGDFTAELQPLRSQMGQFQLGFTGRNESYQWLWCRRRMILNVTFEILWKFHTFVFDV